MKKQHICCPYKKHMNVCLFEYNTPSILIWKSNRVSDVAYLENILDSIPDTLGLIANDVLR